MTMIHNDVLDSGDELDLSNDSAVERITATFVVATTEQKHSESENGTGSYEEVVLESEDFPYPITMRFFTEYEPSDSSKSTDWVKRQRGGLKNLAKAIFGEPRWNRAAAVGKQVIATTKDNGEGVATLGRFKKVND